MEDWFLLKSKVESMKESFNEEWFYWEPIPFESGVEYYLTSIVDSPSLFRLVLQSNKESDSSIEINFKNSVYAYRRTDETFRLQLFTDLSKKYGDDFYGPRQFFTITNSRYISWISKQSATISDTYDLTHYCFMDADHVIDCTAKGYST